MDMLRWLALCDTPFPFPVAKSSPARVPTTRVGCSVPRRGVLRPPDVERSVPSRSVRAVKRMGPTEPERVTGPVAATAGGRFVVMIVVTRVSTYSRNVAVSHWHQLPLAPPRRVVYRPHVDTAAA